MTFAHRITTAVDHERNVADAMRSFGFSVQPFGRGEWTEISDEMHDGVKMLRHAPDLIVARRGRFGLVDCKASEPRNYDSPNVIIECDSLVAMTAWSDLLGIRAIVVWHDMTFDMVESIDALPGKQLRTTGCGSGTPYWLIRRSDLSNRQLDTLQENQ